MTDIDTAKGRALLSDATRVPYRMSTALIVWAVGNTEAMLDEIDRLRAVVEEQHATIERVREVRAGIDVDTFEPQNEWIAERLDAALSDAPVSDAAEPVDEWGETAAQRAVRIGARDAALREYEVESANDGVPLDGPRVVAFKAGYGYGYANRPTDAAEPGARSVDRCPEWNCPDLSAEDRRDGKKCAEHPCTCADAARPAPSVEEYRSGYESWREFGQRADRALLDIWHMAEPSDTAHMTYGDDPTRVVEAVRAALSPRVESTPDENGGE